jgi:hypothetical protein
MNRADRLGFLILAIACQVIITVAVRLMGAPDWAGFGFGFVAFLTVAPFSWRMKP